MGEVPGATPWTGEGGGDATLRGCYKVSPKGDTPREGLWLLLETPPRSSRPSAVPEEPEQTQKKSPGQPQKKSDLNRFSVALFANEGDLLVLISLLDLKAPRAQPTLPRTFLLFSNKLTSLLRFLFSITTKKRCCSSR